MRKTRSLDILPGRKSAPDVFHTSSGVETGSSVNPQAWRVRRDGRVCADDCSTVYPSTRARSPRDLNTRVGETRASSRASPSTCTLPGAFVASDERWCSTAAERETPDHKYILAVSRSLTTYGAPTYRLETYIAQTSKALHTSVETFSMPGAILVSFKDHPAGVHLIRASPLLNLAKLRAVHSIYKKVIHGAIPLEEATTQLDGLSDAGNAFSIWFRVLNYGLASAFMGVISYTARPEDLPLIFVLGACVGALEIVLEPRSELYGYLFAPSTAFLAAFIGRALDSIHWNGNGGFCFSAIAQASIVMILPGFTITNSALELQSKNMVSGSVRMVYGIIYTLFLTFGFSIGIAIFGAIDRTATVEPQCKDQWPFWWQCIFVLPFTLSYSVVNQSAWADMPVSCFVAFASWIVSHFSGKRFPNVPPIAPALGSLTAGVLANLSSRLGLGFAIVHMYPAIFIQVPGSFAASGGLLSGIQVAEQLLNQSNSTNPASSAQDVYSNSAILRGGYTMVEVAIGITVGLSMSTWLVYPFRKPAGKSGIFSL